MRGLPTSHWGHSISIRRSEVAYIYGSNHKPEAARSVEIYLTLENHTLNRAHSTWTLPYHVRCEMMKQRHFICWYCRYAKQSASDM